MGYSESRRSVLRNCDRPVACDRKRLPASQRLGITVHFDQIVVGSSLEALLYAFVHEMPVFYSAPHKPFRFDHLDVSLDLACLKIPHFSQSLKTHAGTKVVGTPKNLLWERLIFLLSIHGHAPLSDRCENLRYNGENIITFSDAYTKLIDIDFDECYYFGDDNARRMPKIELDSTKIICYDWIAFNRGGKHDIDYIESDDDFVKEIWFYSSDRIDGKTPVKDACVVSHLTEKELEDFDFSETMARFKAVSEMEARGMKGKYNGLGPNGKPKHYKFRTTCIGRGMGHTTETFGAHPAKIKVITKEDIKDTTLDTRQLLQHLSGSTLPYKQILDYL